MFQIRVTKVPDGEAPLEVREKWVGLVLPCVDKARNQSELGVLSMTRTGARDVYYIPQEEAINALRQSGASAAVEWWKKQGIPDPRMLFVFGQDEAVPVGQDEAVPAETCPNCGAVVVRCGTCVKCMGCGYTSGCT